MSYLLGCAYRGFKWTVCSLGTVGGTGAIIYGATTAASAGTGIIVVGAFLATQSLIIAADTYRSSRDLTKYIDEQRRAWIRQKSELDDIITDYKKEHAQFLDLAQQNKTQLARLKAMQNESAEERRKEKAAFDAQIAKLTNQMQQMNQLQEQYKRENAALAASVSAAAQQIAAMRDENQRLLATESALKEQVVKLHDLHEQSKQLLKNLVLAGDTFTQFETRFGSATQQLSATSDQVKENVDDLQATLALLKEVASQLHTEHVLRSLHHGANVTAGAAESKKKPTAAAEAKAEADEQKQGCVTTIIE